MTLTQGRDDYGVSHTSASSSREKSRREDADREYSRSDAKSAKIVMIIITNSDNPNRKGIKIGEADGVVTPLSLQRVIDRCSFVELMLKRLYRRVTKKGRGYAKAVFD